MPPFPPPQRLARAPSTVLIFEDGRAPVTVPPAWISQSIAALRLDPAAAAETPLERLERRRGQCAAMLGPAHAALAGELTDEQVGQVLGCLYAAACGYSPEDWQRLQAGLRARAQMREGDEMIRQLENITLELAVEMRKLPDEVGAIPLADALSLSERLAKEQNARRKWEAALAGATVR